MPRVERAADLGKAPQPLENLNAYTHVSLGDIHGNALKLMYILIEEGVLKVTSEQYATLHRIYMIPVIKLTKEDIKDFENIVSILPINPQKAITIIGDELADRGNNDYFTLLILKKLHKAGLNIDIMLSNHSVEY